MSLPDTHIIKLRFKIDSDAPLGYMKKWLKLKTICENGDKKEIIGDWLHNCEIRSIKDMPSLNRCEGGIGGDNNLINKQLRFRRYRNAVYDKDNDIVIDDIISTEQEKWLLEELDDLIRGFRIMANNYVGVDCIRGCIEMLSRRV